MGDGEGVNLTAAEALALARLLIARQVRDVHDWLDWEDVPELTEDAFDRLRGAVNAEVTVMTERISTADTYFHIDSAELFERVR